MVLKQRKVTGCVSNLEFLLQSFLGALFTCAWDSMKKNNEWCTACERHLPPGKLFLSSLCSYGHSPVSFFHIVFSIVFSSRAAYHTLQCSSNSGIKKNLNFTSHPEFQSCPVLTNHYFQLHLLLQLNLFTFSNKLEINVSCISL